MEARIVDREVGTMVRASMSSRDREEARRANPIYRGGGPLDMQQKCCLQLSIGCLLTRGSVK